MTGAAPTPTSTDQPIPLVDLRAQYAAIGPVVDSAMRRVVERGDFIMGQAIRDFETAFASLCGVPHAIGVSSGTEALFLTLQALGLRSGDEVIVPSMTFTATAEAVVQAGGRPVFADVRPDDLQIDTAAVTSAIGPRTRGVIAVDLYGMTPALDDLERVVADRDIWLVEDAAQAHGAEWHGRRAGAFGSAACFSFYPGKNLGAYGDAGMVVTRDQAIAERVQLLRNHGRTTKYEHIAIGYGARLDTLQAAVLLAKLSYLEEWNRARVAAAQRYDVLIGARLECIGRDRRVGAVHHIYAVRIPDGRRDAVLDHLQRRSIGAGVHYPIPLHLQRAYLDAGLAGVTLPVTEQAAREVLSLPLYPEITEAQQKRVVDALFEAVAASA